jgi:hypothetical protein
MRKVVSLVFVSLMILFSSCREKVKVSSGPAELAFKTAEIEYDFGTYERVKEKNHTFTFYNLGSEPLVIHDVESGCDCVELEWTKTPVAPGKTGTIRAHIPSLRMAGKFDRGLVIHSNSKNGDFVIRLKGHAVSSLMKTERR